jgi:hypothetical protein
VALVSGSSAEAAVAGVPVCVEVTLTGLGDACARADGFFQIEADEGTGLLVHGNDVLSTGGEPASVDAPRSPVCAPEGSHRMVVIYARPADTAGRFDERIGPIRDLVTDANALLNLEAAARGATADYRVACTADGDIAVRHEALPTASGNDSFNSVVSDLRARGYDTVTDKMWVWYEGAVGYGIAGTGHLYWDESRSVNNANNAGPGASSTFAVLWGQVAGYSLRTWMHENAHNLGAVQRNAPDSSGAAHCTDGQDIMCYRDTSSTPYDPDVCTDRTHFDCGHDSYFDPDPAAGSYLATSWNLAWRMNRFIDMRPTVAPSNASLSVLEGAGETLVTLRRAGIIDVDLPVVWSATGGSADDGDVSTRSGEVTILSGQRTAQMSIPVTDDSVAEPDETVSLSFGSGSVGAPIPGVTLTIVDDDGEGGGQGGSLGPMPDVAISIRRDTAFRGENALSPDARGQRYGRRLDQRKPTSFYTRIGNDGDVPVSFGFRIDAGPRAWVTVRDAATGASLLKTNDDARADLPLQPGASRLLHIQVTVARGTPGGVRRAFAATLFPHGDAYDERDVALGFVNLG